MLPVVNRGRIDRLGRRLAQMTVVAVAVDVQQTSVGVEADPPQQGRILQGTTDARVPGSRTVRAEHTTNGKKKGDCNGKSGNKYLA